MRVNKERPEQSNVSVCMRAAGDAAEASDTETFSTRVFSHMLVFFVFDIILRRSIRSPDWHAHAHCCHHCKCRLPCTSRDPRPKGQSRCVEHDESIAGNVARGCGSTSLRAEKRLAEWWLRQKRSSMKSLLAGGDAHAMWRQAVEAASATAEHRDGCNHKESLESFQRGWRGEMSAARDGQSEAH
ncbi:hypothetical protein BC831DRAFT_451326 [Entophlyctis helioformis]|nr:hypothetical protein BC831DRAFT_451326 [Entophlyctis helioformis]